MPAQRTIYQSERIPEYWIVDPDAQLVDCWTPSDERPAVIGDVLRWQPEAEVPALEIDLPEFFASALD